MSAGTDGKKSGSQFVGVKEGKGPCTDMIFSKKNGRKLSSGGGFQHAAVSHLEHRV